MSDVSATMVDVEGCVSCGRTRGVCRPVSIRMTFSSGEGYALIVTSSSGETMLKLKISALSAPVLVWRMLAALVAGQRVLRPQSEIKDYDDAYESLRRAFEKWGGA